MKSNKLLLAVSAAAVIAASAAAQADPHDWHHADRHVVAVHHDRYWRDGYRDGHYVARDRVFFALRHNGYARWQGDPYWWDGRYGVRCYDRFGHVVFCEVNPYTGGFVGVIHL